MRLSLLEQGAIECLFKPFSDTSLLEAITAALQVNVNTIPGLEATVVI